MTDLRAGGASTGGARGRLDLVIPGAQKAGTSTLLAALGRHPQVVRHASAELGVLLDPTADLRSAVGSALGADDGRLRVAKCAGLMHDDEAMRRVVETFPGVRFLVMLRDPVARAYSAFWFARRTGDEPLDSFEKALAAEPTRTDVTTARRPWVQYAARSSYLEPLRLMRELVGADSVHVVLLEDLAADPEAVLDRVQRWLGLDPVDVSGAGQERVNAAAEARSARIARMLRSGNPALRTVRRMLPGGAANRLRRRLLRLNERPLQTPPLAPEVASALRDRFVDHDRMLAAEFGLDLVTWTRGRRAG